MGRVRLIPATTLNPLWVRFLKPFRPHLFYKLGKTYPIRVRSGCVLTDQAIFAAPTQDTPRFLILVTQGHSFPT